MVRPRLQRGLKPAERRTVALMSRVPFKLRAGHAVNGTEASLRLEHSIDNATSAFSSISFSAMSDSTRDSPTCYAQLAVQRRRKNRRLRLLKNIALFLPRLVHRVLVVGSGPAQPSNPAAHTHAATADLPPLQYGDVLRDFPYFTHIYHIGSHAVGNEDDGGHIGTARSRQSVDRAALAPAHVQADVQFFCTHPSLCDDIFGFSHGDLISVSTGAGGGAAPRRVATVVGSRGGQLFVIYHTPPGSSSAIPFAEPLPLPPASFVRRHSDQTEPRVTSSQLLQQKPAHLRRVVSTLMQRYHRVEVIGNILESPELSRVHQDVFAPHVMRSVRDVLYRRYTEGQILFLQKTPDLFASWSSSATSDGGGGDAVARFIEETGTDLHASAINDSARSPSPQLPSAPLRDARAQTVYDALVIHHVMRPPLSGAHDDSEPSQSSSENTRDTCGADTVILTPQVNHAGIRGWMGNSDWISASVLLG